MSVFLVSIFIGTIVFAMLQGIIVQVLTTGDPDETDFRQNLDALNFMMHDNHIEKATRLRVRHFYRMSKTMLKRRSYVNLIDATLSDELRGDVRYLVSKTLFDGVWCTGLLPFMPRQPPFTPRRPPHPVPCNRYFNQCERSFLEDLSMFVKREGYATGERIDTEDALTVLVQGVCSRGGAILLQVAFWGDVVISSKVLRDTREAKALAYCEIARVSRDAVAEVSKGYPKSAAYLRYAGLKLATKRSIVLCSLVARIVSERQPSADKQRGLEKQTTSTSLLSHWQMVRKQVGNEFNPLMKALRTGLLAKKQIAFLNDKVQPVDPRLKPTSVLQMIVGRSNEEQGASKNTGAWREIRYDDEGHMIIEDALGAPEAGNLAMSTAAASGAKAKVKPKKLTSTTAADANSAALIDLGSRVDALTNLLETMEANRRADSREVLHRLARLEGPMYPSPAGGREDFYEDASFSRVGSYDAPPRRNTRRMNGRMARSRKSINGDASTPGQDQSPPDLGA